MTREHPLELRVTTWLLIMGLAGLICALCVLCLTPPISRDALTQHLAVPKLYLSHGGIYEIPFMVFSYYPMNLNLLYMIPLYFGNDIIPKFIHFGFALLTSFLIFFYLRHRMNRVYGLLGMLFFLSLPIVIRLSITVYVDLGLVFFSTASLLLIIRWLNNGFPLRLLIFSAICCGLGMGTKYNGLIVFLLLGFFVPFLYARYRPADRALLFRCLGQGMVFVFVAGLVFSPWMIRNYLWTQNPIYPLYDHWFNSQSNVSQSTVGILAYRSLAYQEQWWEIALLPIRVFFQGQDNNPQYFDGQLNPGLFVFPFFAFLRTKDDSQAIRREKMILLAFAILFFGFAFFAYDLRARYILPMIPPLILLTVMGLRDLIDFGARIITPLAKRGLLVGVLGAVSMCLLLNFEYVTTQFRIMKPLSYLSGSVSREEYISNYRPEYPVLKYVNNNLSSDTLVLFLFMGNRGYYCDREYLFDMEGSKSLIQQIVENSDQVEDIGEALLTMKITHILMHDGIFRRWVDTNPNNKTRWLIRQFVNRYLELLCTRNGYSLYALHEQSYEIQSQQRLESF
jgi:hypothetical protein